MSDLSTVTDLRTPSEEDSAVISLEIQEEEEDDDDEVSQELIVATGKRKRDYSLDDLSEDSTPSKRLTLSESDDQPQDTSDDACASLEWSGDGDSTQAIQAVKRRHRKYYDRRVKPFPRVLKRDIRRTYANMLINVMNSYDVELIVKFFTQFCLSNCYLFDDSSEAVQIQPNAIMAMLNSGNGLMNNSAAAAAAAAASGTTGVPSSGPASTVMSLRQVRGPERIALHMLRGMDLVPDCVVNLKQASIHQYLNTAGSKIVCKVTMSGTKLFKYAFTPGSVMLQSILHQTEAQEQVYNVLQMVLGESAAAKLSMEDISQYFQKIMVPNPVDVSFAATITMYLDEEHRIYRLDFTN